ncbi:restriction endonuclease subunit S [Roseovarius sp.]|uniref:restriction endonuclease subunit S n=1 Tax=Roseovarius sp. TaxID=1486281 RepID=UPI00356574A3
MLERPSKLTSYRFDQLADQINQRVMPAEADVERYVGLEHLDPDSLRIRRWGDPSEVESTKLRFEPRDIIFGKRRVYQRKVAVADTEGICSAHAMVLRAKPDTVLPEFLPFFMQSDLFMERALSISVGSLSPTINWKALAKEEFLLPPIQEQARLVEVFSASDRSADSLLDLIGTSKKLLASLIDETASKARRADSVERLEQLVEDDRPICYGILMPGLGCEDGVPVIKVRDYPNGEIEASNLLKTTPEIDAEYRRSRLRHGDLLISIRGTIGRLAFVPAELDGANITQDTARLSLSSEVNSGYVRAMLESTFVQRQIMAYTTGLAVKGINIGELRKLSIPLAERSEQDELVLEIEKIRSAQLQTEKRLYSIQSLKKQLIAEAFG